MSAGGNSTQTTHVAITSHRVNYPGSRFLPLTGGHGLLITHDLTLKTFKDHHKTESWRKIEAGFLSIRAFRSWQTIMFFD
jgi:hypothetical protein